MEIATTVINAAVVAAVGLIVGWLSRGGSIASKRRSPRCGRR
jgi:hypothetical protein